MSSQVFFYEFYEFFLVNVFIEHAAADLENIKHIVAVYLRNVFRTLFSQKSFIIDVWLGSKYAHELAVEFEQDL